MSSMEVELIDPVTDFDGLHGELKLMTMYT
jgi:hypothetical protein